VDGGGGRVIAVNSKRGIVQCSLSRRRAFRLRRKNINNCDVSRINLKRMHRLESLVVVQPNVSLFYLGGIYMAGSFHLYYIKN
jgi:hypothetical protein